MKAEEFNLFRVIDVSGFDLFGPLVAEEAQANGNDIALVFIAHQQELSLPLTNAFVGHFETIAILFDIQERFEGGDDFDEVVEARFFGTAGINQLEELAGNDGGRATGKGGAPAAGNFFSTLGHAIEVKARLFVIQPVLVAALTPGIEVLADDGCAIELGGENFLNAPMAIEPGKDDRGGLTVEEALVELLADFIRKAADFANGGAVGVAFFFIIVDDFFVRHLAILADFGQSHS